MSTKHVILDMSGLGYTSLHWVLKFDAFVDGEGMYSGGGSVPVTVAGGGGSGQGLITPGQDIITNLSGSYPWVWGFQECHLGLLPSLVIPSFSAQHPDLTDTQGNFF